MKKGYWLLMAWLVFVNFPGLARAQDPTLFSNCRLGASGVKSDVVGYDVEQLNLGLYQDWRSRSTRPAGLPADVEYIQTVRVHQDKGPAYEWFGPPRLYAAPPAYKTRPSLAEIATLAANLPGSLWLIGNEVERVDWLEGSDWSGQDEITPELYATAFHDIQVTIKAADPTARIAIGGVIQGTPLRLKYLDRVWASYLAQYGYPMGNDIDVWNMHAFLLREVRDSWGAEIPAGLDDSSGFLAEYNWNTSAGRHAILDAHHNMDYYRGFIEDFRTWMAAHGERNKPLLNSEYGILFDQTDISLTKVQAFLTATFDYMLTATDEQIGYPADENRLVQGWMWYSLNDDVTWWAADNRLFKTPAELMPIGEHWKNYVTDPANPLASQPQLNLLATNLRTDPTLAFVSVGESVSSTLTVDVANNGNTKTSTGNNIVVKFWAGFPNAPGSNLIGDPQVLNDIPGCGRLETTQIVWSNLGPGVHKWYVEVMPIAGEINGGDNISLGGTIVVIEGEAETRYLPLILK